MGVSDYVVSVPTSVTWKSYTASSQLLEFSYPTYSDDAVYNFQYVIGSTIYYLPATSLTSSSIYCTATDGSSVIVSYTVTSADSTSALSAAVTLYCAALPGAVASISYTSVLKQVTLKWPSVTDTGGSTLLGYTVFKYTTSWVQIGSTSVSVLTYTDTISYGTSYKYTVYAYNIVGSATSSFELSLIVSQAADATKSTIVFPSSLKALYPSVFTVNLKDSGGNTVTNPSLMLLEIRDVCSISTGYECIRVSTTDINYVPDLLSKFTYVVMTDNKDGTMSASYTPPLAGPYSISVIQLQPSGVLGNYWDNIWFLAPLDHSSTTSQVSLSWNDGVLITTYSSEYISAKYFTFAYAAYSETYTIYITADDNFRLYVNGILILDAWTICCNELSSTISLIAGTYNFFKIEYRQLDSSASISMSWSSPSISKVLVPSSNLYWPIRVNGSPSIQTVAIGLSTVKNCYFTGPTSMIAGEIALFKMYSVNEYNEIIDNYNDVFALSFQGNSSFYFVSIYQGAGMSYCYVKLGTAEVFSLNIQLYGNDINGSPLEFAVNPGYPSLKYSYVNKISSIIAGTVNLMGVVLLDNFENPTSGCEVTMTIVFVDKNDYISPISVADVDQSVFGFNHSGSYISPNIEFSAFIAGNYKASVYLDEALLIQYSLSVVPSDIIGSKCVPVFSSTTLIAGMSYTYSVQTRDLYSNNILVDSLTSYTATASGPQSVEGVLTMSGGVGQVVTTLTVIGTYTLSLTINTGLVGSMQSITVTVSDVSVIISTVNVPTSQLAGVVTYVNIYVTDEYGNLRNGGDILTYLIAGLTTITGTISDLGGGNYNLTFTPYLVDTYTVTIYYNSNVLGIPQNILVTNSNIRGLTSIYSSVSSQVAGKGSLTITSKDIGGNTINNPVSSTFIGSQVYYGSLSGPQTLKITATYTDLTAYKISLTTVNITGTYSLLLGLTEEKGLNGFYFRDNSFLGLYSYLNYHNFLSSSPAYYTQKDQTINFSFASTTFPDFFSAYWQGFVRTTTSETYTFYVESDKKIRLTVNGLILADTITGSTTSGSTLLTLGIFYSILLEYKNGGNNGSLVLKWSSSSISKTVVPSSSLFSEIFSSTSPYSLTITPDTTSASVSSVVQYPGDVDSISRAYVNVKKYFNVIAKDKFGNQASSTSDVFTATLTQGTTSVTVTIANSATGTYTGSFTATLSGTYTLKVSLSVSGVLTTVTSLYVYILTGPTDPTKTSLVDVPSSLIAGAEGSFIIIAKDSAGSQQIKGGDTVVVSMFNTTIIVPSSQITIKDNDNGSYTTKCVVFLIGNYTTQIYMNSVLSLTVYINITSAAISLTSSLASIPTPTTFGSTITSDIYIRDMYTNPIYVSVPLIMYLTKPTNDNFKPLKFTITTVDLSKGRYSASAVFTLANVDKSGICTLTSTSSDCNFVGDLTVWTGIFDPMLLGQYYNNPSASGAATITQRDSTINFNWGSTVQGLSALGVSVVWTGFIRPTSTKVYTLYLAADDWAEVFIDNVSVMSNSTVTTTTYSFTSGTYYLIKVNYNNTLGDASISLSWVDTTTVAIPSTVLYYILNQLPITGSLLLYTATAAATS